MKKVIFKYDKNDTIEKAMIKYFNCILLIEKLNTLNPDVKYEYEYEDKINQIEEYKFFNGLDHFCDDIGSMYGANFHELKKQADSNIKICGFNTLGFFKSKIEIDKLTSTQWINPYNCQGIFVKNVLKLDLLQPNFKEDFLQILNGNIQCTNYKILDSVFEELDLIKNKVIIYDYIRNNLNDIIRFDLSEKTSIQELLSSDKIKYKNNYIDFKKDIMNIIIENSKNPK